MLLIILSVHGRLYLNQISQVKLAGHIKSDAGQRASEGLQILTTSTIYMQVQGKNTRMTRGSPFTSLGTCHMFKRGCKWSGSHITDQVVSYIPDFNREGNWKCQPRHLESSTVFFCSLLSYSTEMRRGSPLDILFFDSRKIGRLSQIGVYGV